MSLARSFLALLRAVPAVRATLAIALLATLAMCSVPLLGIHGPESALVLGVLLPPMAAFAAARIVQQLLATERGATLAIAFEQTLLYGAALFLLPLLVLALDALRIRNCSPLEGLS